jgi:hypothetical protein
MGQVEADARGAMYELHTLHRLGVLNFTDQSRVFRSSSPWGGGSRSHEEAYRGTLGAAESTLPIFGEADILESGLVGFTGEEIKSTFGWIEQHILGIDKPKKNDVPAGSNDVFADGTNTYFF